MARRALSTRTRPNISASRELRGCVKCDSFNSTASVVGYRPITAQKNLLRTPLVRAKLTRVASIRQTK